MEQLRRDSERVGVAGGIAPYSHNSSGEREQQVYVTGAFEEDEEMSVTERELAEDAEWKRIQQNTFTRWVRTQVWGHFFSCDTPFIPVIS